MAGNIKFAHYPHEKEVEAMCRKELFIVGAAIVIVTAVMMFFPLTGSAGSPDPPTPPILNEVLKKLDNIPPAWSQKLPAEQRFVLVLDDEAVLDKETGLVWERDVSSSGTPSWYDAIVYCTSLTKGGRNGWHLPTIEQLASQLDMSVLDSPKLPEGHPFIGVLPHAYWSATTDASNGNLALSVGFNRGLVFSFDKLALRRVWCVRGGQSHDGY